MKYLDEMTVEELINLAMEEGIFLELNFDRGKTVAKLEEKGYERKRIPILPIESNSETMKVETGTEGEVQKTEEVKIVEGGQIVREEILEEKVEEVDFSVETVFPYRSRNYYRNYPNRKLMRVVKRIHRGNRERLLREIEFNYEEINTDQIRRREVETEINRSKFAKGAEFEGKALKEDIYFDKAYLPNSYFVDEVVLMPKNPTTLFVYWEIRDDTFENLINDNREIVDNIIIKLFKDGDEFKKIVRHERIGSHYITEVDASQSYEVFVGYEDQYGNFSEVAHSSQVIVPSDKLSNNFDLLWGTVKEDKNTNQIIKYVNSPIPTDENKEFMELSNNPVDTDGEFTVEVLERLLKVGASEQLIERREVKSKPDKLIMTGVRSS